MRRVWTRPTGRIVIVAAWAFAGIHFFTRYGTSP
jgi:hypothetical protein